MLAALGLGALIALAVPSATATSAPPLARSSSLRSSLVRSCRSPHRRITFSLPDAEWAGGFGDRVLGLATTYYLALMTSSGLDVNWTRPYELRDYFYVVDCAYAEHVARGRRADRLAGVTLARSEHYKATVLHLPPQAVTTHTVRAIDRWEYFQNGTFLNETRLDINVWTNGRHWLDVVKTHALAERAATLSIDSLSRQQLFKLAVDALLSPRRNVVEATRAVMARLRVDGGGGDGGDVPLTTTTQSAAPFYVGVQIRCGSHGSLSWYDPTRHSLADVPCFVEEAVQACGARTLCPIFLTADSQTAANAFRAHVASRRPPYPKVVVVEADGPILHTDRTNATSATATGAADPWLRSIVDWWLLKHASALVISRSGFGETAAWASSSGTLARRVELGPPGACNVSEFDARSVF